MSANQLKMPTVVVGADLPSATPIFASTQALNAAATWIAYGINLNQQKTLSKVKLYLSARSGTPTAAGCTCELYSDSSGVPGSSVESANADSVPAAGNWMQWTFAGTSVLDADTQYWLVFKNGTATPGSNAPTYQYFSQSFPGLGAETGWGWNVRVTTNSGGGWTATTVRNVGGLRVEYTDATFEGFPIQSATAPTSGTTGNRAFGTQEVGVRFNIPAGVTFNVLRAGFMVSKTSTPGDFRLRLWQGVTLLATGVIPVGNIATSNDWRIVNFTSAQGIVSTDQPFRLTMGDATAGDANTVGYNGNLVVFENDADSLALKPMNGTVQKTITADNTANPVVFTDTPTEWFPFFLILDTLGEFTGGGSGGGLRMAGHGGLAA